MKDISIINVRSQLELIEQVILLGDKNQNTLGFFPRKAFYTAAEDGKILAAIIDGRCVGYLLFRIVKTMNKASITHLCVDKDFRHEGVGICLVEELKKLTKNCAGISLYCRRDYESNNFWSHIGFIYKSEKLGRGKDKIPL